MSHSNGATKPKAAKSQAEIPASVVALHAAKVDYDREGWQALNDAKNALEDEIAYARVLARKGLPAEQGWRAEKGDPRLAAWLSVHEKALNGAVEAINQAGNQCDYKALALHGERLAKIATICGGGA